EPVLHRFDLVAQPRFVARLLANHDGLFGRQDKDVGGNGSEQIAALHASTPDGSERIRTDGSGDPGQPLLREREGVRPGPPAATFVRPPTSRSARSLARFSANRRRRVEEFAGWGNWL